MSEMGEIYYAMKEANKAKRARNRKNGLQKIEAAGYQHTIHNNGAHIVIIDRVDYWPGTGKFKDRVTKHAGRGIARLLKHLQGIK